MIVIVVTIRRSTTVPPGGRPVVIRAILNLPIINVTIRRSIPFPFISLFIIRIVPIIMYHRRAWRGGPVLVGHHANPDKVTQAAQGLVLTDPASLL
jgi:hypothetical protein